MRKPFKKFTLIGCVCALAMGFAVCTGNSQTVSANTTAPDSQTVLADVTAPDLQTHGASVRKANPSGLRFTFSLDKSFKDAGYTFGTLVIPKSVLGDNVLNHNDDAADEVDVAYVHIAQEKWATTAYCDLKAEDENHFYEEGREYFNAVLLKIPETEYGTTLVARSYALKDGVYYYSDPVERSIAEVASKALQSGEDSDLLVNYVDTALANQTLAMNVNQAYVAVEATQNLDVLNDNGYAAIWASSNNDVVTVDNNGQVTAKSAGTATISATIGSKTVKAGVKVGEAIEGDKLVDMQAAIASGAFKNENANATVEYAGDYTQYGDGMAKITATKQNQATGQYIESLDVSEYSQIVFRVYRPAGKGGYFLRVKSKNDTGYPQIYSEASIDKRAGDWVEVTLNVSDFTNKNLQNMYIQFGTNDTTGGATPTNDAGKYIYVSDIYGVGKVEAPKSELVVSMKDSISSGAFKAKNTNSTVAYSTDYMEYGSGMAKVTANINTQAYGWYCKSLDVSAYTSLTFKVFRPAGLGGYYVRVKTGDPAVLINSDASTPKNAGEWVEITVNVADIANKNLNNLYIQFGTDATNAGVSGKFIYISDIYGIK